MSTVLHRTNKEVLYSVNTPDYPDVDWIINPDLVLVYGVPKKYWKITGDVVSEMNQSEKDIVDAALLPQTKIDRKNFLRTSADNLIINQGYTIEKQLALNTLYANSTQIKSNRYKYINDWALWIELINHEVKIEQDLVDLQTTIDAVNSIILDSATLIAADPGVTLKGTIETTDDMDLATFLDSNAIVEDAPTGIIGPFYLMQILMNRRELFNDSENPLYHSSVTPILGDDGYLVDHAGRINNLEVIHGKLGWHNQQLQQALYKQPKDLLIYYGWLNSFNSATNGWNNELVAQEMAKYQIVVMGDGIEDPTHGDYANSQIIIARIKILNPSTLIFGYVAAAQTFISFEAKVDQWNTLAVHGIFIDEAGYDYGKTRAEFNTMVDYVHGKTNSHICFANSWNTDHILGTTNDVSFPNSTFNNPLVESKLNNTDWILLESFPINTTAYSGNNGYESKSDWIVRGNKAVALRYTYGVNFASCGIINDGNVSEVNLFKFGFISSLMFSLEAFGTSDAGYGAGSAKTKLITRPDISNIGIIWYIYPSVVNDTVDTDKYYRYLESARLELDFSTGAQTSLIRTTSKLSTIIDADGTLADATIKINSIIDKLQELGLIE
jgi:hypothetical protein